MSKHGPVEEKGMALLKRQASMCQMQTAAQSASHVSLMHDMLPSHYRCRHFGTGQSP